MGANPYSYDNNGNVLSDGERTLTWTAQDKVHSPNRGGEAWSLLYDADGTRVVREEAAANEATYNVSPTYELRFEGTSLSQAKISVLGTTGRVVAEVVADRTELPANERWENKKSFVHDDHLGSTHTVTDREAAVQSRATYRPWGRPRNGGNWYLPLSEVDLEDLPTGFTGHQPELDAELINMRGPMYDPAVGRLMSVDPVIEDALEVGTRSAYSYVQNRPLSRVDPTGLASEEPIDREAFVKMEAAFEVLSEGGYVDADGDGADLRADFLMASGLANIEDVREGDLVVALDPDTGEWGHFTVGKLIRRHDSGRLVRLDGDGEPLIPSDEHPFWLISNSGQDPRPEIAGRDGLRAKCGEAGVLSRGVLVHNKPYMTSKGWAADYANQRLKHWKTSGVGTGATSGQHRKPFARAAADIPRTTRAKSAGTANGEFIGLDAEVLAELAKKEVEFLNRATGYNHAVKQQL